MRRTLSPPRSAVVKSDYCVDATASTTLTDKTTHKTHTHTHTNAVQFRGHPCAGRVVGSVSDRPQYERGGGEYRIARRARQIRSGARTKTGTDRNGNKHTASTPDLGTDRPTEDHPPREARRATTWLGHPAALRRVELLLLPPPMPATERPSRR